MGHASLAPTRETDPIGLLDGMGTTIHGPEQKVPLRWVQKAGLYVSHQEFGNRCG